MGRFGSSEDDWCQYHRHRKAWRWLTCSLLRCRRSNIWSASSKKHFGVLPNTGLALYSYRKIRALGYNVGILSRSHRFSLFPSSHVFWAWLLLPSGFKPWIAMILGRMWAGTQVIGGACTYSTAGLQVAGDPGTPVPACSSASDDCSHISTDCVIKICRCSNSPSFDEQSVHETYMWIMYTTTWDDIVMLKSTLLMNERYSLILLSQRLQAGTDRVNGKAQSKERSATRHHSLTLATHARL